MSDRPFNPLLMARLELEAEAIVTVISDVLDRGFADLSNQVANWQPRDIPARDEWDEEEIHPHHTQGEP